MIIKGKLCSSDYINTLVFCRPSTVAPLLVLAFISGLIAVAVAVFVGYFVSGRQGVHLASLLTFVLFIVGFLYSKIRMAVYMWLLKNKSEMNNVGDVEYRIDGRILYFVGPMYRCEIPISSIRAVRENRGTTYLEFGNYSGLVVPAEITVGRIDEFRSYLRDKVVSA